MTILELIDAVEAQPDAPCDTCEHWTNCFKEKKACLDFGDYCLFNFAKAETNRRVPSRHWFNEIFPRAWLKDDAPPAEIEIAELLLAGEKKWTVSKMTHSSIDLVERVMRDMANPPIRAKVAPLPNINGWPIIDISARYWGESA